MTENLLPCPFCGGEARLDQRETQSLWNSSDAIFSHVTCDECDIHGQDFCDDPDGEEAIEWWNRRAALAAPVQGEAVAWYTEDQLDDKSATTWRKEVAERWKAKGWPVSPLYTSPQPAPAQDVAWLVASAKALLDLDEQGALTPHGIGGLARDVITGFIAAHDKQSGEVKP